MNLNEANSIDAIVGHTRKPVVVNVHGIDVLLKPTLNGFDCVDREEPTAVPAVIHLGTLCGLLGYIRENRDQLDLKDCVVHVRSHTTVDLVGRLTGSFAQRIIYARAEVETLFGQSFTFGRNMDHETFVVGLQALFVDDLDRAAVLRLVSSIRDGQVRTSEDDGVSQAVTSKSGFTLGQTVEVPNPVQLRPYRTFREIEQPSSPFILRLKSAEGMPHLALHEADGGYWKLVAISSIAAFLQDRLAGAVPVLA